MTIKTLSPDTTKECICGDPAIYHLYDGIYTFKGDLWLITMDERYHCADCYAAFILAQITGNHSPYWARHRKRIGVPQ